MNEKHLTIAIVGNSPILLEKEYGKEIDSHDIVIRINNFVTKGYEKHTGTKTTDIIIAIICIKERGDKYYQNLNEFLNLTKEHRIIRDNENVLFKDIFNNKITKNDVILFNNTGIDEKMRKRFKYNKWFSTGLVTMQYIYDIYPNAKIDVYGITFFKDKIQHFYDNIQNTYHDSNIEEDYFNNFLKDRIKLHN